LFVLPLSLFHLENHVCLSRGVQVAGATWRTAMRIMAEVGDLIQRTGDDRTGRVLSGRMIERSGGVMCGLHCARGDEERGFFDSASKSRSTVFSSLASKPVATVSSGLASKPVWISWLSLKTKVVEGFSIWASKPVTTV
jgi:hypothetical protein